MRKRISIFILSISLIFISAQVVLAQENKALFVTLQRELAGDPATWQFRGKDPNVPNNPEVVLSSITPGEILATEEQHHTSKDPKNTFDVVGNTKTAKIKRFVLGKIVDKNSLTGKLFRQNVGTDFFEGTFILTTRETTELGKIRDLYTQITNSTDQRGTPRGADTLNACLAQGIGMCRHLATILHESLNEVGVKNSLILSPEHVWVRVTLSDLAYDGLTFDLDPMWYQQAIPLPPRSQDPIAPEWKEALVAITSQIAQGQLNLNGKWVNDDGSIYEFTHSGNGLAGTLVEGYPGWIGKIIFSGQLTDLNFTGNDLWRGKDKCSKWERSSSASGSVSSDGNTFTIISRSPYYYTESCEFAYEGEEEIDTYTRKKP